MADIQLTQNSETAGKGKSADEIFDILNVDDDKAPIKEQEDKEDEPIKLKDDDKDEPEKKTKEDDIELEEDDEENKEKAEKLDLKDDKEDEINAPPRKREIIKEFPEFFKKFPWMEKMMYRDREYTEMFGSFDEAKALYERSEAFSSFEQELLSGNTEEILRSVKDEDPKAFDKIVDNYLMTLAKVDRDSYFHVINGVGKRYIEEMWKEGKETSNEELQNAAVLLNQFLFGTSKYTPHQPKSKQASEADDEVQKERQALEQERFSEALTGLQTRVDNVIKNTLDTYMDPRGKMSSYAKRAAVEEAKNLINESLAENSGVKSTLNKLWKQASEAKYSRESLDKIRSFYLGKAKQLMPAALKKVRAEALKDSTPQKEEKEDREERRERVPSGRPASQKKDESGMKKGESVLDFLSRD